MPTRQVKFVTRIYHPNVKTDSGEICSDILNENWGPTLNVTYVLNTIRQASAALCIGSTLGVLSGLLALEPAQFSVADRDFAFIRTAKLYWRSCTLTNIACIPKLLYRAHVKLLMVDTTLKYDFVLDA